ncbi:hypothetical protein HKX48_009532 [Thoreauomyces humboldtii]|nr:hypothetical protein HKX48_009532 [Thoreauomyces humboldtii]
MPDLKRVSPDSGNGHRSPTSPSSTHFSAPSRPLGSPSSTSPNHVTTLSPADIETGDSSPRPTPSADNNPRRNSSASGNSARTHASTVTYQSSNFEHPDGEVGIAPKHKTIVKVLGRVGFAAKSIIYGVLGGLFINVAAGGSEDSSPQGVFVLVGDNSVGIPILVILAISLVFYVAWRWWEAFTGQGSDNLWSKKKNFFKYRVSPFVSGAVYAAYTYYVIKTLDTNRDMRDAATGSATTRSSFPDTWVTWNIVGKIAVALLGVLFLVATCIQWQVAFQQQFYRDLYQNKLEYKPVRWFVLGAGHVGFFSRGCLFLLIAILMFRSVRNADAPGVTDDSHSVTGKAVTSLATSWWGRTILVLIGSGLLIYAVFAFLNVYFKIFPTPPPSREPAVDEKDKKKAEEKRSEDQQNDMEEGRGANREGHEMTSVPHHVPHHSS